MTARLGMMGTLSVALVSLALSSTLAGAAYAFAVCAGWAIFGTAFVVVGYAIIEPRFRDQMYVAYYRTAYRACRKLSTKALTYTRHEGHRRSEFLWNTAIFIDPRRSHWLSVRAGVLDWDCAAANEVTCGGHLTIAKARSRAAARARLAEHHSTDQAPDLSPVCR